MKHLKYTLCALVISSFALASAKADVPALSFTSPGNEGNNGGGFSLGWAFTSTTAFTVTSLGYFDNPDIGLTESHQDAIYTSGGTLVAQSGAITGSGTQIGFFNYEPITPVTLAAGTYEIVGSSGYSDPYAYGTIGLSTASNILFLHDAFGEGNNDGFAMNSDGLTAALGGGFFGANFLEGTANATPEPSSLALLGTGMAGIAGMLRRRFKK